MKWFNNLQLTIKLRLIIALFSFGLILFGLLSYNTIEKLRVNGEMYLQIVQGKDLIADILPPPDYIVESYLNAFQMLDEYNESALKSLIEKSKSLREEYNDRHEFWVKELSEGEMKNEMVDKSYNPAVRFYDLRDNKFIPLVLSNNREQARVLLDGEMKDQYELHRSHIDKVVQLATIQNGDVEAIANEVIKSRTILLLSVGIIILVLMFFIISGIFKNISNAIKKVLKVVGELAKGHVKERTNIYSNDEVGQMAKTIDGMAQNLDEFATLLHQISKGDLNVQSTPADKDDALAPAFNSIVSSLKNLIDETSYLTNASLNGELKKRGDENKFEGGYREIISGINHTLDAMVKPINESSLILEKMAQGDLSVSMSANYKGDFSIVSNSINSVITSLNSALFDVAEVVKLTVNTSTQISDNINEIASGSDQQSTQINEVSTAMEEMAATITDTTRNIVRTNEAAAESKEQATNGQKIIESTISGMKNIETVVKQASEIILKLGHSSEQIGHIVQVINEIADQTNLLALNAAIEAARAGENGRGFAVVADEVKKLAERTTVATNEIAETITKIQADSNNAVTAINKGNVEVSNGMSNVIKASDSMDDIVNASDKVLEISSQVAATSEQQSTTIEQITKSVDLINNVAQEAAIGVQHVANSTGELQNISEQLQVKISKFRLSGSEVGRTQKERKQKKTNEFVEA